MVSLCNAVLPVEVQQYFALDILYTPLPLTERPTVFTAAGTVVCITAMALYNGCATAEVQQSFSLHIRYASATEGCSIISAR